MNFETVVIYASEEQQVYLALDLQEKGTKQDGFIPRKRTQQVLRPNPLYTLWSGDFSLLGYVLTRQ